MTFRYLKWNLQDKKNIDEFLENKYFESLYQLSTRQKELHLKKYNAIIKRENKYYYHVNTEKYLIVFKEEKEEFLNKLIIKNNIKNAKQLYEYIKKEKILGISKEYCFDHMKKQVQVHCPLKKKENIFYVSEEKNMIYHNNFSWDIKNNKRSVLFNIQYFFLHLGVLPTTLYFLNEKPKDIDNHSFFKDNNIRCDIYTTKQSVDNKSNPFSYVPAFYLNLENYKPEFKNIYLGDYAAARKLYKTKNWTFKTQQNELILFQSDQNQRKVMYYSLHGTNKCVMHFLSENKVSDIYDFWLWLIRNNKFMLNKYNNISEIRLPRFISNGLVTLGNITSAIVNYQNNRHFYFIPYRCGKLSNDTLVCSEKIKSKDVILKFKDNTLSKLKNEDMKYQKVFVYCYDDKFDKLKKYIS